MKTLLLATALTLSASAVLADEIRVLNWQGYGTDVALSAHLDPLAQTLLTELSPDLPRANRRQGQRGKDMS